MERWLEVIERVRSDIQVEPDGEQTKAFRWGSDGAPASLDEIRLDARVISEMSSGGAVSEAEVRRVAPVGWTDANWSNLVPRLAPAERVQRQTFWLLELPSIEVAYAVAGTPPTVISFEGRRLLAPPSSVDTQFAGRARQLYRTRNLALAIAALVPIVYLARGHYFWNGWLLGLSACSAAVAMALYGFVRESTLCRSIARRWGATCVAATVALCAVAFGAEPSLRSATRLIESRHLEKARAELAAIGRPADQAVMRAWAELGLAEVRDASDPAAAARAAATIPAAFPQREVANHHLVELASAAVSQDLADRQTTKAQALLDGIAPTLRESKASDIHSALGELTALVQDQAYAACREDDCRWQTSAAALAAAPSETRTTRARAARTSLLSALALPDAKMGPLARVEALDAVLKLAHSVDKESKDPELTSVMRTTIANAEEQRSKVALLGADYSVAARLLGVSAEPGVSTLIKVESSVGIYCTVRGGRCAGIYIAGTERGARALNDAQRAHIATKALSQAVGGIVGLPEAPSQSATVPAVETRWRSNGIAAVARWHDAQLIELRLGDISP